VTQTVPHEVHGLAGTPVRDEPLARVVRPVARVTFPPRVRRTVVHPCALDLRRQLAGPIVRRAQRPDACLEARERRRDSQGRTPVVEWSKLFRPKAENAVDQHDRTLIRHTETFPGTDGPTPPRSQPIGLVVATHTLPLHSASLTVDTEHTSLASGDYPAFDPHAFR
jgi:hypothetical protein